MSEPAPLFLVDEIQGGAVSEPVGTFEDLLHAHQSMVFSLAFHSLRDRGLAEDIAQEVFLRLSKHLPSLGSPGHAIFWLRQVTCRLCIDEIRRRPRRDALRLEDLGEPAVEIRNADPFLKERIRRLVGELPEKVRMAVVLRYQEDLEFSEIAALLQEPLPTVKSRIQRALTRLKESLKGWEGEGHA